MKNLLIALLAANTSLVAQLPQTATLIPLSDLNGVSGVLLSTDGHVYASDAVDGFVNNYDSSGLRVQSLQGITDYRVPSMAGLDYDGQGEVLVAQKDPCQVVVFDASGQVLRTMGNKPVPLPSFDPATSPWVDLPNDLSVGPNGRVYVADTGHHRVAVYDVKSGAFLQAWGRLGYSGSDRFAEPRGISVANNLVYVADSGNARVMVYDLEGVFVRQIGARGIDAAGFDSPFDVAIDGAGRLWVADNGLQKIVVFDTDDTLLRVYGGPGDSLAFEDLSSLYAGESGVVVAGDGYTNRAFSFETGVSYSRSFETKPMMQAETRLADARVAFGPVPLKAGQVLRMTLPLQADSISWDLVSLDMRRVGSGVERNSTMVAMADTHDLPSGIYMIRTRVEDAGVVRQEIQKIIVTR